MLLLQGVWNSRPDKHLGSCANALPITFPWHVVGFAINDSTKYHVAQKLQPREGMPPAGKVLATGHHLMHASPLRKVTSAKALPFLDIASLVALSRALAFDMCFVLPLG